MQVLLVSNWNGWSHGADFRDNTFAISGTGRYGHGVQRNPDGTYAIAPGWGGATGIQFQGNRYFGHNIDAPEDAGSATGQNANTVSDHSASAPALNWNEPLFNPAHPANFSKYLAEHRQWMLRLFTSQFGHLPLLEKPQPLVAAPGEE